MDTAQYLEEMKLVQKELLDFFDETDSCQNLKDIFIKIKIHDNKYKIKSFLHLLVKFSNNHHRNENFFAKIEEILQFFEKDLKQYFKNWEIFNIFKSNKRILLFLFDQKILIFDKYIVKQIINEKCIKAKYPQYFKPEIKPFINEKWFPKNAREKDNWINEIKDEIPDEFYEKRKIGENDSFICRMIQNDSIMDFVTFVNKNNYSLKSKITPSIYETNNYLLKNKKITLIQYAAFYGSIQIFNYLRMNGVRLAPPLWHYAIHGKNAEIIHLLEENRIKPSERDYGRRKSFFSNEYEYYDDDNENDDKNIEEYLKLFKEAIKCHHNDIANYIQNTYLINEELNETLIYGLKYYNFIFIQNDKINDPSLFYYFCRYDHCLLYILTVNELEIDINKITIFI